MITNRQKLLDVLKLIQPALAKKEIIEQSTAFAFTQGRVLTYNDRIAISHPLDLGFEGAVQAKELVGILGKLKDEEITVEALESELLIQGKRSKAGIRLDGKIALPLDELSLPTRWTSIPEGFLKALSFCQFSASSDMTKPLLTCISAEGNKVSSCDNFRLTQYTISSPLRFGLLLPAEIATDLVGLTPVKYGITDGWAHFCNKDDVTLSARVFEGKYPDLSAFLSLDASVELSFPVDLKEILERAGVFSAAAFKYDESIDIVLEGKHMTVRGEGPTGWFEEKVPVRWTGKEKLMFSIHPEFLSEILPHVKNIQVSAEQGRMRIEGDSFVHVIVLPAKS